MAKKDDETPFPSVTQKIDKAIYAQEFRNKAILAAITGLTSGREHINNEDMTFIVECAFSVGDKVHAKIMSE